MFMMITQGIGVSAACIVECGRVACAIAKQKFHLCLDSRVNLSDKGRCMSHGSSLVNFIQKVLCVMESRSVDLYTANYIISSSMSV